MSYRSDEDDEAKINGEEDDVLTFGRWTEGRPSYRHASRVGGLGLGSSVGRAAD